jgi:hypothetical protein
MSSYLLAVIPILMQIIVVVVVVMMMVVNLVFVVRVAYFS